MDWGEVAMDSETHLKRLIDMYKELHFEVRVEEVKPQDIEQCTQCLQHTGEKLYRVYTRHTKETGE